MDWKKLLPVSLLALLGLFLLGGVLLPKDYRVARATVMQCTPEEAFTRVADLRTWKSWSPWQRMDPEAKTTYQGAAGELGASMAWNGEQVGVGTLTFKVLEPHTRIQTELRFIEPFASTSNGEWLFEATLEGTRVTWANYGELGYPLERYMGYFMFDNMLGSDFEAGLAELKKQCEAK
jgi:hypothetical protein